MPSGPLVAKVAPQLDITSANVTCGRLAFDAAERTEIADVVAGTLVGFKVGQYYEEVSISEYFGLSNHFDEGHRRRIRQAVFLTSTDSRDQLCLARGPVADVYVTPRKWRCKKLQRRWGVVQSRLFWTQGR